MSRFARGRRVYFVEEAVVDIGPSRVETTQPMPGLTVVVPHITEEVARRPDAVDSLVRVYLRDQRVNRPVAWLYTPMSLALAASLDPVATVYDCMDELSAFHGAPPMLTSLEKVLFERADIVFTGGMSLYESKRLQHANVHAFPSSVDLAHFEKARESGAEPPDQASIARPRLGYFGVIDERIDLNLLAALADADVAAQIVMIGPVVKIDEATLPQRPNIHYLGMKSYDELPSYIAGWDVALMPFALNEATKFISPTKTLEYLAAGKLVVSTAIRDVVSPYGERGLVRIADDTTFASAVQAARADDKRSHLEKVDALLAGTSWDSTWAAMAKLVEVRVAENARKHTNTVQNVARSEGETECSTT